MAQELTRMLVKTTLLDVKRYREGSRLARTLQTRSSVFVPEVNGTIGPCTNRVSHWGLAHKKSLPQVENVLWTGWNDMSFTAYTND